MIPKLIDVWSKHFSYDKALSHVDNLFTPISTKLKPT